MASGRFSETSLIIPMVLSVMAEVLFPISSIISMAKVAERTRFSVATGANMRVAVQLKHFVILFAAELFVASPACDDVSCMCEPANVSTIVTCQASAFPLDLGIGVAPSDRHYKIEQFRSYRASHVLLLFDIHLDF